MPTINPYADAFDREVGCGPHWSRSDSGREPKSFVHSAQFRSERQQVSSRPAGYRSSAVDRFAGKAAEMPGVTRSQWHWCTVRKSARSRHIGCKSGL